MLTRKLALLPMDLADPPLVVVLRPRNDIYNVARCKREIAFGLGFVVV